MSSSDPWLAVALILRPHSLRGAVQLKPYTRTSEEFLKAAPKRLFLREGNAPPRELTVSSLSLHKGLPLVLFKEITDRTQAEFLKGLELVIPTAERWERTGDSFLPGELDGFDVIDAGTGEKLGIVLRLDIGPAHDHLVFTHPTREDGEVMLPVVSAFIRDVALQERRITVILPDGLLEL